jgi:ATP-dependent Clp protease ATP-binding subunit ClpC
VNRFDEVVLFRPLTPDELLEVVDLLISEVNKSLNRQKVSVALTEDAKTWLVEKGYDPRLGARPMRRMVQRSVENIVAKKLLENETSPGEVIELDVSDLEETGE